MKLTRNGILGLVLILAVVTTGCGSKLAPRPADVVGSGTSSPPADASADLEVEASSSPGTGDASSRPSEVAVDEQDVEERPEDGAPSEDAAQSTDGGTMLSSCAPSPDVTIDTLVDSTGPRPDEARMEAEVRKYPDLTSYMQTLEAGGVSHEDALHDVYAQVIGESFIDRARTLTGFASAAFAGPLEDRPFRLAFDGPVPDALDTDAYELGSYGLVVTSGVRPISDEEFNAGYAAAEAVGLRVIAGYLDDFSRTALIEVFGGTPEQVASWEAQLADPSLWCLIAAEPMVRCDDDVVAAARDGAPDPPPVLPAAEDGDLGAARRATISRSYIGMDVEAATRKAEKEQRGFRVLVEDGVGLAGTSDFRPGRVNATSCRGVVVDVEVEAEG